MKRSLSIICVFFIVFLLSGCGKSSFDGSRTGNDSQFVMKYKIFNTTDEQSLLLESGDIVDSGKLSIKIQKDSDTPIYERDDIVTSENFDVEIQESGTYKITVIGENTKGGVNFKKVDGEKAEQEEIQQGISKKKIDLGGAFQEINGCAVIYSPVQEEYSFFNEDMCRQEVSPYSTFKIISALLGLQKGVIVDESSTMGYDGTDYGNAEWNGDLTLEEAFEKSCIWYFREVIDLVGRDKMQEELKNLQYGNCDISEWNGSNINPLENLNGFWLDSSLKISPLEQVEVLSRIFEGHSDYDSKIYGKTGSGNGEAWFVGFSESDGERKYIAIYLNDSEHRDQISGNKAKEMALEILK